MGPRATLPRVKIALLIGGSTSDLRDSTWHELRSAIEDALPVSTVVSWHEPPDGHVDLVLVTATHPFEPSSLSSSLEAVEADVPVVWLYPNDAERALGARPCATFPLDACGGPEASLRFLSASIARVAAIGAARS